MSSNPLLHFAVLDIYYQHLHNAVLCQVVTNNPCHLWAYHTYQPPWEHLAVAKPRGLLFQSDFYTCFVAYTAVEQREAGDTLIHTFTIPAWNQNEEKYLVFRGTVADQQSPSSSPIIDHKNPGQDFILNPLIEDWPLPQPLPTGWRAYHESWPYGPISRYNDEHTYPWYGAKCEAQAPYGSAGIRQTFNTGLAAGLDLTISASINGYLSHWTRVILWESRPRPRTAIARPTLMYQWETCQASLSVRPDTTALILDATILNQAYAPWIHAIFCRFDLYLA